MGRDTNVIGVIHIHRLRLLLRMTFETEEVDRKLDAREVDGEPFDDIMDALDDLGEDESLLLVNSFEPEPLYNVLENRGFEYETENPEPEVWHVRIEHG